MITRFNLMNMERRYIAHSADRTAKINLLETMFKNDLIRKGVKISSMEYGFKNKLDEYPQRIGGK